MTFFHQACCSFLRKTVRNRRHVALSALLVTLLFSGALQAAKNGAVAVALPPFVPTPAPQPFLPPVSPFDIVGFIQSATVDNKSDYFSGGTLEVNGVKVVIPRNTIFQFPTSSMTWADMFRNAPAIYQAANQSGLALSDTPKPLTTYEVHVQGNRVVNPATGTDSYIAGLVYLAQHAANVGTGIVNAIDYSKCVAGTPCMPDVWVGSTLTAKTGARIRFHTPNGRFGAPDVTPSGTSFVGALDRRFAADEDNPSIATGTGYPLCLPRFDPAVASDSLCPQWNRPRDGFTGAFSTIFTMQAATAGTPDANGITHQVGYPNPAVKPDPFEQAPLEVGDQITYSGNIVQDAPCVAGAPVSTCQYISAYAVTADVAIFTAPGSWPVYIAMGEYRLGVGGTPNPLLPQEAVDLFNGEFFTSDSSQLVDVYAIDVNSTTGATRHRLYGTADPFGPPLGGVKGRARLRVSVGNLLPPTRYTSVASRALTKGARIDTILPTSRLAANGLRAGYFEAPNFEYIFAENLVIGSPQIPLTLQEFPFLANGSGPYVPFGSPEGTAPVGTVSQLSPWPNLNAPVALSNSFGSSLIQPPIANAGAPQTVSSGATVTLSGAASSDPNSPAMSLTYTWQQTAGTPVALLNSNPSMPTQQFVAPTLAPNSAPVVLTFMLGVCNGFTCGGVVSVNVTVVASTTAPSVSFGSLPGASVAAGTAVTLSAAVSGGTAPYTYSFRQTAGPTQSLTVSGSTAKFTAALPAGTPTPATLTFEITVVDALKGTTKTTTNVLVGPDTITITTANYSQSKLRVQIAATDSVPGGLAVLTATPIGASGAALAAGVALIYNPTANSYSSPQSWIVSGAPTSILIKSSLGGSKTGTITIIK